MSESCSHCDVWGYCFHPKVQAAITESNLEGGYRKLGRLLSEGMKFNYYPGDLDTKLSKAVQCDKDTQCSGRTQNLPELSL